MIKSLKYTLAVAVAAGLVSTASSQITPAFPSGVNQFTAPAFASNVGTYSAALGDLYFDSAANVPSSVQTWTLGPVNLATVFGSNPFLAGGGSVKTIYLGETAGWTDDFGFVSSATPTVHTALVTDILSNNVPVPGGNVVSGQETSVNYAAGTTLDFFLNSGGDLSQGGLFYAFGGANEFSGSDTATHVRWSTRDVPTTFFNGTSTPASLIFGVTMHLSAGGGITPFTGPVAMVPTQNANIDRVSDADSLFFSNFEIPSALGAFEGAAVTAIVYGKINADAQLEITSIGLAQGEAGNGCVDEGPLVASRVPCTSTCGEVCAAIALASAGPLCGSEQLPAVLNRRIDQALQLLRQVESTDSERKAKRGVTLVMRQLRRSATIARAAAKKGLVSAACAEAVGKAVRNAQSQAEPWLRTG